MASVDYDPIKAHEYYEKHKKLKGRHSQKGMSDDQKAQWAYAKQQLKDQYKAERDQITDDKSALNLAISERMKEQKKFLQDQTNSKIEALRESLKNMPKEQKAQMKENIKEGICIQIQPNSPRGGLMPANKTIIPPEASTAPKTTPTVFQLRSEKMIAPKT